VERLRRLARKIVAREALRYGCGDPAGKVDVVALKLGIGKSQAQRVLSLSEPDRLTRAHLDRLSLEDPEAARAIRSVDTWSDAEVEAFVCARKVA
jgi:hypothetical protein